MFSTKSFHLIQVNEGQEAETKAHYTLKIVTNGSAQGMDFTLTQIMSMKGDNLVISSEAASDMGEMMETFVFDKQ